MVGGEDVATGVLEVAEDIRGAADTKDDWDTEDGEEDVGIVGGMMLRNTGDMGDIGDTENAKKLETLGLLGIL